MLHISNALGLIVESVFGILILAVLLRLLMQLFRVPFSNPLGQVCITLTNFAVRPLRRLCPPIGHFDLACLVLLLVLAFLKVWVLVQLSNQELSLISQFILGVADLVNLLYYVIIGILLIRIVISWVAPQSRHPILSVVYGISEPIMAPLRRLIPAIGMLDLSPIVLFLGLQVARTLIVPPLYQLAAQLA